MSVHPEFRGGAPVARLETLPEVEARLITWVRLWCEGPRGRGDVRDEAVVIWGHRHGPSVVQTFETFVDTLLRFGRRGFVRHQPHCSCVGSDEAVIAHAVALSATGAQEDALMVATLLVRVDMAPALVASARQLGLALRRAASHGGALSAASIPPECITRH